MDISKWAFKNRNLVYFLVTVLFVGGILSCYQMSKLEDPEIKVKLAMVVTTYPGASAHQVELEVTDVLEKSIRSMGNIDNVESYSYNDLSLIQVELTTITPDDEVEQCWDMLRRKVSDACALLPDGASTPIVKDDFGNVYGMFYALTGDGLSDRELSDYAELIKREISDMTGVERVELYGKRPECINISLLQDRMANLGVKPAEVLATLNGQNKTTYSGYYDNGDNRIRVTVSDKFRTVEDIGSMLIQGHDDDQLRMRDIARIEKGYEEPTRNELFFDSERAQGILIAASRAATSLLRSCFLKSSTDRCSSWVPFCSHSMPCLSITAASCSFSALIHWFSSDSRLEPPAKPKDFRACFRETLVSSPLPFQPDTYGTKSMCRWGVASSMWRKAPNTRSVGFRSWKPCIYSSSSSFASTPFSVRTPISSLLPIWTINSWKSFSCLPVRRCS